ncbi:esterase [Actinomyces urogenitalis]|uniref:Esterase n=1 Tax=Actinomyces urogenitalis TaxID=103621 RepID=A0A2I1KR13_9ACTO|nr:alpha/beta hydrolase-fold protein [Actinomyces urogenitalis]PKY98069.1 esterase [Actinomyces urogenitalis]
MRETLITTLAGEPRALAPQALTHVSLVSTSLVHTVFLAAVVAVVLTGVLVAVRVRPGQRRAPRALLVSTVAALVLSQVLVLAAVGLRVNASLGFVQTVGDLAAVASSRDSQTEAQLAPVGAASAQDGPTQPPAEFTPAQDGFVKASVTGARSGVTQEVWVWTPQGYSTTDQRSYPVIVFLYGDPGSASGTVDTLKASQAMQAAIDSGALPPAIFVIPDLNADEQQKSSPDCADIVGHAKIGTWIQDDVPAVVRASFPNVSKDRHQWALAGLSSGGYCAGWTAIMRSDVYSSAIMMSGYDVPVLGGMSTSAELRRENTLSTLITHHAHQPLDLWVLGAQDDHDSAEVARNLRETAPSSDSVEITTPSSGGHSWTLWSSHLPQALTWWGQKMGWRRPPPQRDRPTRLPRIRAVEGWRASRTPSCQWTRCGRSPWHGWRHWRSQCLPCAAVVRAGGPHLAACHGEVRTGRRRSAGRAAGPGRSGVPCGSWRARWYGRRWWAWPVCSRPSRSVCWPTTWGSSTPPGGTRRRT